MNRRDFLSWMGKLLMALPFVALADLESESVESLTIDRQDSTGWTFGGETIYSVSLQYEPSIMAEILDLWQKKSNAHIGVMPWDLEGSHEEVERLSKILSEVSNANGYFYRNILQPDSETIKWDL